MAPEANKQQRSAVDTLQTRLAFILRGNSKRRAAHTTNWQSKLMCNWATGHFREPPSLVCRGRSHTSASLASHYLILNLLSSELIMFHHKGQTRRFPGAAEFRGPFMTHCASWRRRKKTHICSILLYSNFQDSGSSSIFWFKYKFALHMFKQMKNVLICVTTASC